MSLTVFSKEGEAIIKQPKNVSMFHTPAKPIGVGINETSTTPKIKCSVQWKVIICLYVHMSVKKPSDETFMTLKTDLQNMPGTKISPMIHVLATSGEHKE